jgi:hypothetical protein
MALFANDGEGDLFLGKAEDIIMEGLGPEANMFISGCDDWLGGFGK